jgi:hypothetical protein
MKNSNGARDLDLASRNARLESAYQELPPLGGAAYVEYVRTAPKERLPPEVLVRAWKQLGPESPEAMETLKRLFGETPDGRWEYLGALASCAWERSGRNRQEYEDLFQDSLAQILTVLPSHRGKFAERAWAMFCRQQLSEVWRKKYGRRSQRKPKKADVEVEEITSRFSARNLVRDQHPIPPMMQLETIERVARRVLFELKDDFTRSLARAAWFENERPKQSGKGSADGRVSLTELFPEKSRDKIIRTLKYADAQLAAALRDEPLLELGPASRRVLEELARAASQGTTRRKERRK